LIPFGQLLAADDLEQIAKLHAVGKVAHKVLNLHHALDQERVAPARERSLLNFYPRLPRGKKRMRSTLRAPKGAHLLHQQLHLTFRVRREEKKVGNKLRRL
jgi:hypothetical protein